MDVNSLWDSEYDVKFYIQIITHKESSSFSYVFPNVIKIMIGYMLFRCLKYFERHCLPLIHIPKVVICDKVDNEEVIYKMNIMDS